ncbi:MAG: flavin monoamine oxidase family protein [Pseudobdellovibrionaceae bacterium]
MKKATSRRQFIQSSALLGGAGLLSSCASIDQYFRSDSSLMMDRVVIVGAGLAGLHAAYQLKKRRIPFCVFEASQTYGGRIKTLYHYNQDDQYVDVGAKSIEGTHQDVFSLCKELGVKIRELGDYSQKSDQLVFIDGKPVELKSVLQELVPFFRKVSQLRNQFFEIDEASPSLFKKVDGLQNYDRISFEDLLTELQRQMSPEIKRALMQSMTSAFGIDASELSALQFLYQFNEHGSQMPFQRGQSYGVDGGSSALTQKLFERSNSIVKNHAFKFSHRLTSIGRRGLDFLLNFKTQDGDSSFMTRNVIFALPSNQLKTIIGWRDFGVSDEIRASIENVSLSESKQVLFKSNSRFWERKYPSLFEGKVFGDFPFQKGESLTASQSGNSSVYAFQVGGKEARQKDIKQMRKAENFLQQVFQLTLKEKIEFSNVVSWGENPFIQGYQTVYQPGSFFQSSDVWRNSKTKGIYFAGEHVHPKWIGTMQGAILSSQQAIQKILNQGYFKAIAPDIKS